MFKPYAKNIIVYAGSGHIHYALQHLGFEEIFHYSEKELRSKIEIRPRTIYTTKQRTFGKMPLKSKIMLSAVPQELYLKDNPKVLKG